MEKGIVKERDLQKKTEKKERQVEKERQIENRKEDIVTEKKRSKDQYKQTGRKREKE